MPINVLRGPATSPNAPTHWTSAHNNLSARASGQDLPIDYPPAVLITWRLEEGGRGAHDYALGIEPDSFAAIADLMMKVEPMAAIRAFTAAMQKVKG